MDCEKVGKLIAQLRSERSLTQKNIADALGISNKTVSKWECGLGCPDLSLWPELSVILGVDMAQLMEGEITRNRPDSGNISRIRFCMCPVCGNVLFSTGSASIHCCGRKVEPLKPEKDGALAITVEEMDTDYYVSFDHPMEKDHYLVFAAYVKSDRVTLHRLYPEQDASVRCGFPCSGEESCMGSAVGMDYFPIKRHFSANKSEPRFRKILSRGSIFLDNYPSPRVRFSA